MVQSPQSPTQSSAKALKVARTHQHPDGTVHALSSDGVTCYTVGLEAGSCTCPAGSNGRRCYHLATARRRYPSFYPAPWPASAKAARPHATAADLYR